jgi:enediyne biosynthesis protein E7
MRESSDVSPAVRGAPPGPERELSFQEIRGNPLEFIARLVRDHGDIVQYRAPGWRAVVVNQPSYVKHVLLDNFDNYGKEGTPDMMMLKPMLGDGLLTSDGADWDRQRRYLHPVFQRHQVERFARVMTDAGREMLDGWQRAAAGSAVEMSREMTTITLRIVARALFGYEVVDETDAFAQAVEVLNEKTGHMGPDDGSGMSYGEALGVVRSTVHRVVIERLTEPTKVNDTLGVLIEHSRRGGPDGDLTSHELMDQVLTLMLAGHETTAKTLCWTAFLISQHPDVERQLLAEAETALSGRIPTVEDLPQMPYAWAVIQEAMRIYPPIWLTSRLARADDVIDGYTIPAETLLVFSPFLIHRRLDTWVDPERFRPERFINSDEQARISTYSYLPFGGGPRQCIGRQFASLELRLLLPMIYQRFHLEVLEGHPVEAQALVTLRPKYGLPMHVHPR